MKSKRRKNWLRSIAKTSDAWKCAGCKKILFDCTCYRTRQDMYDWLKHFIYEVDKE